MDVKVFAVLFWASATWQISVNANEGCIYEGRQLKKGPYPFETHPNTDTEEKCKDICDSDPLCVIWQWQPNKKKCWIIYPDFKRDANSDFGINNCKDGKPTENAPECKVEKGNREHKLKNHWGMAREECIAECSDDSDCLIWQYFRKQRICQIHKLQVDTAKKSQVGIHYCSSSTCTSCTACSLRNPNGKCGNTPQKCGIPNRKKNSQEESRITGGTETGEHEYPWQVAIWRHYYGKYGHNCGGSLISDKTILTAAHCFENISPDYYEEFVIKVGIHNSDDTRNDIENGIEEIVTHPDYITKPEMPNDIAIITLKNPVAFDQKTIAPICLPFDFDLSNEMRITNDFRGKRYEGKEVILTGFMDTDSTWSTLKHIKLETMNNKKCAAFGYGEEQNKYSYFPFNDQMCAYNEGQIHSNNGDSGGPFIFNFGKGYDQYELIGTLTGRQGPETDKSKGWMVVLTRVTSHLPFIKKHFKGTTWTR